MNFNCRTIILTNMIQIVWYCVACKRIQLFSLAGVSRNFWATSMQPTLRLFQNSADVMMKPSPMIAEYCV